MSKNKPVNEVRLGRVRATTWKNETEKCARYTVNFSRLYRKNDQWADTTSFGRDDLLPVAKVADLVHTWIFEQKEE